MLLSHFALLALGIFLLRVRADEVTQTCINSPTQVQIGDVESLRSGDLDSLGGSGRCPGKSKYFGWTLPPSGPPPTDRVDRVIEQLKWERAILMAKTVVSSNGGDIAYKETRKPLCEDGIKYLLIDEAWICELRGGKQRKGSGKNTRYEIPSTKAGCDSQGNCEDFFINRMLLTYSCNGQARAQTRAVRFEARMISGCKNFTEASTLLE
jgi:hypothetical protein